MSTITNITCCGPTAPTALTAPTGRADLPTRRPPIEVAAPAAPPASAAYPARVDSVDLSEQARLLDALRDDADVRHDVVARIKDELDKGTYLSDAKLDRALDALIDDVLG